MKRKRLLCILIQEADGVPKVQSFVDSCEGCGKAVWRAESSNKRAIAICRHCVRGRLESGEAAMVNKLSKRQIADIRQAMKDQGK